MLLFFFPVFAAAQDTARVLKKVTVQSTRKRWIGNNIFSANSLSGENLRQVNTTSVADLARLFPGTLVKDYGGIGGLKTVSVRSLGAHHSAVLYDGMAVSDMQGGQVDLGKISAANLESVTLSQAQPSELLLPARAFASASVLMLQTQPPGNQHAKGISAMASVRGGSFGFINPALAIGGRTGRRMFHRFNAEYQRADGDYPFDSYDNSSKTDRRLNADAANFRAEYDVVRYAADSSRLVLKAYHYYSDRGLPGSVVFFNQSSRQRLTDRDLFVQSSWRSKPGRSWMFLASGKYSYLYKRYVDPDFLNARNFLENRFREQEAYGSAAVTYQPGKRTTWAFSTDLFSTRLRRSGEFIGDSSNPSRLTWLNHAGAVIRLSGLQLTGGLLSTLVSDRIGTSASAPLIFRVTPTVGVHFKKDSSSVISVRAFYKDVFRMPTFNDLYYTFVGNINLRPERARLFNVGVVASTRPSGRISELLVSADGYYNRVTDKIMAVPRLNLFQWSMMNVGRVDISGIDLTASASLLLGSAGKLMTRVAYTYQQALDKSNPASPSYGNQLPYTPEHSGSISVILIHGRFSAGYHGLFSSLRYRPGDQIPDNQLNAWSTQDIRLSWQTSTRKGFQHEWFLECNNMLNTRYEIIRFYPMPGFNYRLGYIFRLNNQQL